MHREQLEEEVKLISDRTQQILTNALIIGGALAATYLLISTISGSGSKKKSKPAKIKLVSRDSDERTAPEPEPEGPGMMSQIGTALASQAAVFLLALAKDKLTEFLQSQMEKKMKPDESSS